MNLLYWAPSPCNINYERLNLQLRETVENVDDRYLEWDFSTVWVSAILNSIWLTFNQYTVSWPLQSSGVQSHKDKQQLWWNLIKCVFFMIWSSAILNSKMADILTQIINFAVLATITMQHETKTSKSVATWGNLTLLTLKMHFSHLRGCVIF